MTTTQSKYDSTTVATQIRHSKIAFFRSRSQTTDLTEDDKHLDASTSIQPDAPSPVFSYDKSKLHVAICRKITLDGSEPTCDCSRMDDPSDFEESILKRWDEAYKKKMLNYNLNLMYKLLPGKYYLTAQLNIERGTMRRKPHPFRHVQESYDSRRFNFHKIRRKEILLDLRCTDRPYTKETLDRHLLIVNASPIERGHSLGLCCVNRCTNQILTRESLLMMCDMMLLVRNSRFHCLFNSLLAFASVNHQHFHALFWPYNPPIIKRPVTSLTKMVHFLNAPDQWFVPAYVVQLTTLDEKDAFIRATYGIAQYLINRNVAHNLFWARSPKLVLLNADGSEPAKHATIHSPHYVTAYIFPRKSVPGNKPLTKFSPAASELAGNLLIFSNRFFHTLTEQDVLRIVEEECALAPEIIANLNKDLIKYLDTGKMPDNTNDFVKDLASLRLSWASVGKYDQISEQIEFIKDRSGSAREV